VNKFFHHFRKEAQELNISDSPFLSTIGERSMNGLGTYYGTFMGGCERKIAISIIFSRFLCPRLKEMLFV